MKRVTRNTQHVTRNKLHLTRCIMKSETKPLPFSGELEGISKNTTAIHHDKLYAGYVAMYESVKSIKS